MKLSVSFSERVIGHKLFLPIFAIIVLGLSLAGELLWEASLFARSGSLLVILAVVAIWKSERISRKTESFVGQVNDNISIASQVASMTHRAADWTQEPKRIEEAIKAQKVEEDANQVFWDNKDQIEALRLSSTVLLRQQVLVVILGTFIWGYGDIFTNLLLHCGEITC
ncbi:MAG: hypothetical protein ABJH45_10905 [Paracoccaceae bacterium]|uniref:hypothetical protein n=1 Tax=Roseobacteraceae TaxID=2854170 RepID=UPI0032992AA6